MATETQTKPKTIVYFVNGERQTTDRHKLTVEAILTGAGFTPATDYRLIRDAGHHAYTNLAEEVPLHDEQTFTALFQGPTPVA